MAGNNYIDVCSTGDRVKKEEDRPCDLLLPILICFFLTRFKSAGERAVAFAVAASVHLGLHNDGVRPGTNLQSTSFVAVRRRSKRKERGG